MAEINLLGTERQQQQKSKTFGSFLTAIFVFILILLLVYYGFLLYRGRQLSGAVTDLQAEIAQTEQSILNNSEKNELFTRQAQLQDLKTLLSDHLYWSLVIPELTRVTLRDAAYTEFITEDSGNIVMTVDVPTYAALDKFLQVFDLPQYSQNISSVKVRSIAKVQEEDNLRLRAKIEFMYNKNSLVSQSANQ